MPPNAPPSPTLSQLPPVPGSPTYSYASTAANPLSQYNLPLPPPPQPAHAVLTKSDLEHSQTAYADLLSTAKSYRLALAALSTAASAFGSALEACARLKEARAEALQAPGTTPGGGPASSIPGGGGGIPFSLSSSFHAHKASTCTADALLTVAGLQHLVANHQHILSETVYRSFEVPLLHELDKWRAAVDDEEEGYASAVAAQSREIRRLEKEGMKLHRQKRRDVAKFRGHLVELTTKLDGLTTLHGEHARTLLRESQETSVRIVDASCSLVRAEVDIFESLARKGWTGGGLEDVLEKGVDLFASEEPVSVGGKGVSSADGHGGVGVGGGGTGEGSKLFSILPVKSILADTTTEAATHTRSDSLLVDTDRYQSLAGAVSDPISLMVRERERVERDRDTESVFPEFNRPRPVRPFSPQPQPLRLNPEVLLGGNDSDETADSSAANTPQEEQNTASCPPRPSQEGETEEETSDEEAHPWRNEGLKKEDESEEEQRAETSLLLDDLEQKEDGTWNLADGP